MESDPNRGMESHEEKIERLYKKDLKKKEVIKEIIEREVYAEYKFQPEINKVSKAIAQGRGNTTIDELAYNPKGRSKKEQLQEELLT